MTDTFITRDSGQRHQFPTGAVRDLQQGKGRFDLLPFYPLLRVAQLFERGAEKYGDDNWRKGMPRQVFVNSMLRHAAKAADPAYDDQEDHLAAVVFNAMGAMQMEHDTEQKTRKDS